MQAIRQTQLLNKRELENATPPSASWHADYRDTAWIYVGGLIPEISEGDVSIIFSQFGNPTHLNLIRDKETGKSKGFAFLKYEDQRSCDLAVDNLGGAEVLGRMLRVDHSRYKRKDGEDEETYRIEAREKEQFGGGDDTGDDDTDGEEGKRKKKRRKLLKEEKELEEMLAITAPDGEEEDPMREYLIREKKEEVERAKQREKERRKHKHRQRRERGDDDADEARDADVERRHHRRDECDDEKRCRRSSKDKADESGNGAHLRQRRQSDIEHKFRDYGKSERADRPPRREHGKRGRDVRPESRSQSRSPR